MEKRAGLVIFHSDSPLPLGEGLGERVRRIEKKKEERRHVFVVDKPSPNPKGEGQMKNGKRPMENDLCYITTATIESHLEVDFG